MQGKFYDTNGFRNVLHDVMYMQFAQKNNSCIKVDNSNQT